MSDTPSNSSGRSKRQKIDKSGKQSAFEKLKQLKGSKHKYEVDDLENVYEEVDEGEYSKTVLKRQNDDWIIDDGESGYVEDGREIFDDDLDQESIAEARKNKITGPRKSKKDDSKKKGTIQNMLMNMPSKKKTDVKLDDDNILGDLMSELKSTNTEKKPEPKVVKNKFRISAQSNNGNDSSTVEKTKSIDDKRVQTNIDDDCDFTFDMPNKNLINEKQSVSKVDVSKPSASQEITDDDTLSELQNDVSNKNLSDTLNGESSSQVIEDESEDLSQYATDFSSTDFENADMNINDKELKSTTDNKNKKSISLISQTKPKDICTEISESENINSLWDTEFEIPTSTFEAFTDTTEISLPLTNVNGETVFRFYWWDAYEDPYKQPGTVYLFGKVYIPDSNTCCSCCVTVKNIPRRIYLLPRCASAKNDDESKLTMEDVYKEFNQFANKSGIKEFRCSKVSKCYAFEQEGIPAESDYLEVRYSANYPPMPSDYSGPAIEHVFGTTTNALELLLIERKIKGPCWLDVKSPVTTGVQTSWCKIKVNCMKIENLSVVVVPIPLPPLIIATLNIRTAVNSKSQQNEVIMIAVLIHRKYHLDKEPPKPPFQQHICLLTHPRDVPWPRQAREVLSNVTYTKVIRCETEMDLLEELLKIIETTDPDLLIGYDCGFQFDILMHRMFSLKVSNWSRFGRLKRATPPIIKGRINLNQVLAGRPYCDIQVSAKELNLKVRSYDLQTLCVTVLRKHENECKEIKPGECAPFYNTISKIETLIKTTLTEAHYIISIVFELNVIPLALQITSIAGNIISRTLTAGRAERNEYLLLHAFHAYHYITPDKRVTKRGKNAEGGESTGRKKAAYAGGLVLEPKKGFYDKLILLMDFNSLYPSIIQEYNLCFTTVPGAAYADTEDLTIPQSNQATGIIPTEIRKLVESRVDVKKLMKAPNISPELRTQYNIRQMALKLTANSMYGCLGATHCRFYAKGLAALITAKGREILLHTKNLVEKMNYEVIYGDTDSIMINTNLKNYDDVFAVGKKIKQEVNKLYRRVELDIDGVFRYLLLLQKKKYAAVTITKLPNGELRMLQEHKGLDIVRRDWCQLACEVGKKILDNLLNDEPYENRFEQIFTMLQNVAKSVRENQVSLSSLVITKQLSKNPNEYPDAKQAHVLVALRLNKEGGRMWKAGDTVPYIICEDGTDKSATERAYHIDEYKKSDSLKIDVNYYLLSQIFPIVLRLCEPIEGIDDVLLAKNLGLEGIYKSKRVTQLQENVEVPLLINEERFKYCIPLTYKCRNESCGILNTLKDTVIETPNGYELSLTRCSNPECDVPPWAHSNSIQNRIDMSVREFITQYYRNILECENPLCGETTNIIPLGFTKKFPTCRACGEGELHKVYTGMHLYNQLCFYHSLFDVDNAKYRHILARQPWGLRTAYAKLKEATERWLRKNAYSRVNLDSVFSPVIEDYLYNYRRYSYVEIMEEMDQSDDEDEVATL